MNKSQLHHTIDTQAYQNKNNSTLMNQTTYDHTIEKEYMSSISDAFQRAEEETRKAEQMLAKWRKDHSKTIQNIEQRSTQRNNNNKSSQSNYSQNESRQRSGRETIENNDPHTQSKSFDKKLDKKPRIFQNQYLQQTLVGQPIDNHQENKNYYLQQQPSRYPQRNLDPEMLEEISNTYNSFDKRHLNENSSVTLGQVNHSTRYQNTTTENEQLQNQYNYFSTVTSQSIPQNQLKNINRSISQEYHMNDENKNISNLIKPMMIQNTSQNTIQDFINIEKESEIIKLDKYYKQLLKSEKDEFQRQLQKAKEQAKKEAEKKLKSQLNDMKDKLEEHETLEIQLSKLKIANDKLSKDYESTKKKNKKLDSKNLRLEEQIKTLQKKLDDLWERQNLEKENIKLISKYEVESESRKTINELTLKLIDLEKQLREKDQENQFHMNKNEELQRTIDTEIKYNQLMNKSQDKVYECEIQVLKQENTQLRDQLQLLEMESNDIKQNGHDVNQKYESLKRKFAIVVKEKEMIEQNRLMETAQFKQSTSQHQSRSANFECDKCDKWRYKAQELTEKYFMMLKNMKIELDQLRQDNRSIITNGQRDIHSNIIQYLKEHLDQMKAKSKSKDEIAKRSSSFNRAKVSQSQIISSERDIVSQHVKDDYDPNYSGLHLLKKNSSFNGQIGQHNHQLHRTIAKTKKKKLNDRDLVKVKKYRSKSQQNKKEKKIKIKSKNPIRVQVTIKPPQGMGKKNEVQPMQDKQKIDALGHNGSSDQLPTNFLYETDQHNYSSPDIGPMQSKQQVNFSGLKSTHIGQADGSTENANFIDDEERINRRNVEGPSKKQRLQNQQAFTEVVSHNGIQRQITTQNLDEQIGKNEQQQKLQGLSVALDSIRTGENSVIQQRIILVQKFQTQINRTQQYHSIMILMQPQALQECLVQDELLREEETNLVLEQLEDQSVTSRELQKIQQKLAG
ncbi:UNKNOWN [Stylonychia lemnae]|uniref:Uncharacterized protein n=1 Tax=Stylonychia lemnae TaxID=5949 RepID=A0A078B8N0_STYLE|nr:UNKNOWN [Stylonychia lemnae]|eukprot:CDW90566.1 UNKNOWN [Stylonychia lemnae]